MPTTRSATKKQTKLEDFEPDSNSKAKQAAKKPQAKAGEHDEVNETKQPSEKKTAKSNEGSKSRKPDSALERGKAKTERNIGATSHNSQSQKPNTSAKRKAPTDDAKNDATVQQPLKRSRTTTKATKQAQISNDDNTSLEKPIIINRSPVLQLWGACVAHFLHPEEPWTTCLSIGGSIATLCAISKGRAVGKVEPKDDSAKAEDKRKKRKQDASKDPESREIEVMGFPQQIREDAVVVDGKPKPLKEGLLQGKFGGKENYERAKKAMEDGLRSWGDEKEELDREAFRMYEKFRPGVAAGGLGWGRNGELNLHKVKSTIER